MAMVDLAKHGKGEPISLADTIGPQLESQIGR